ncbi:hypothetical protein BACI349Y_560031 [Bacillus sp. 349Y]|nr:hypothetical protein BACI349Y_560031 [Bacillus sp. 349Y]
MNEERVMALQNYLAELKDISGSADQIKMVCAAIEQELGVEETTVLSNKGVTIHFNIGDDLPAVYVNGERVKLVTDLQIDWKTKTDKPGKFSFLLKHWEDQLIRSYGFDK